MKTRPQKGKHIHQFPADYTVVDIETTGLNPVYCEILEISAIKVRNGTVVDTFSCLAKPVGKIGWYITQLTGITESMVQNAPPIQVVLQQFVQFLGDDIIIGYNVNFDINFLYDNLERCFNLPLSNNFVDVLRLARIALKTLPNHRQTTVAQHLGIETAGAHRALRDCEICNACYQKLATMFN